MVLGPTFQEYFQLVVLIFAIYFAVTTLVVYSFMFWTGKLIRLPRALVLVAVFTVASLATYVLFNHWIYGSGSPASTFSLPLTFTLQHAMAVGFWLLVLVISVLLGTKKSF